MDPDAENLQNEFFNSARRDRTIVTIFLCNGKRLFGRIKAFDRFTLLLEGHGGEQILFKHAISSVSTVPHHPAGPEEDGRRREPEGPGSN